MLLLVATYNLVQVVFDRSELTADEDVAIITMHIRQVVEAAPDIIPIGDQGRQDFIGNFGTFFNAIRQYMSSTYKVKELRFYDVPSGPGIPMGDPVLVHESTLAGASGLQCMPPQVALSVTFKTEHRKRWGRFYLPGLISTTATGVGRVDPVVCQAVAAATHNLTSRSGTGAALTVFSRVHWNHEDPTEIQVDDIFDVIRRRRFSKAEVKEVVPAG